MSAIVSSPGWVLCRVLLCESAPVPLLEVSCERWPADDHEAVVALTGDLCHFTAPAAMNALWWLAETVDTLTVDMSGVEFIDAGGVTALVVLKHLTTTRAARLEVRAPSEITNRLLDLVGVRQMLGGAPTAVDDQRTVVGTSRCNSPSSGHRTTQPVSGDEPAEREQ